MSDILSALSVLLTGVYAFLTYRILQANERTVAIMHTQISATVRPYVSFDLIPVGPVIAAHLRNTGQTAAHDIKVTVSPELLVTPFDKTGPAKLTGSPTSILSPGREEVEVIGSWEEFRSFAPQLSCSGTVAYSDGSGTSYKESFVIELAARGEMMRVGEVDIGEQLKAIADHLREIKDRLENMN